MRFVNDGDLLVHEIPNHSKQMIPCNIVEDMYWELESGLDYTQLSSMMKITKEQADFILRYYYPRRPRPKKGNG